MKLNGKWIWGITILVFIYEFWVGSLFCYARDTLYENWWYFPTLFTLMGFPLVVWLLPLLASLDDGKFPDLDVIKVLALVFFIIIEHVWAILYLAHSLHDWPGWSIFPVIASVVLGNIWAWGLILYSVFGDD